MSSPSIKTPRESVDGIMWLGSYQEAGDSDMATAETTHFAADYTACGSGLTAR